MHLLQGKKGIIMGVANTSSIAYGIAEFCYKNDAQIALTYQNEAFGKRVLNIAKEWDVSTHSCDVLQEGDIEKAITNIAEEWGSLDFLVHSIAFSDKEELNGKFVDTSRANFIQSLDASCYSFIESARVAANYMKDGGSLLTLSYEGSQRVMNHYNVMGIAKAALESSVRYLAADLGEKNIRVNAISAGPMRTLAGSAIGGARSTYRWQGRHAPLRRNNNLSDIGGASLYLLSDLSKSVTGEVHYVDAGYHSVGMITL